MLVFPQLSTGASAQYPIGRTLSQRSVQSTMEDGTIISLADTSGCYLRWRIVYQNITDQEAEALTNFFVAAGGALQPFLFLDPAANLLLWSEDFTNSAWQTAGIGFDSAIADPLGGQGAVRAHNQTTSAVSIAQQTQIPGSVQTCFSIYLRAESPTTVTLIASGGSQPQSVSFSVTNAWQRFSVAAVNPGETGLMQYAVNIAASSSLYLFGPQVDAQVTPSTYVGTTGWNGVCSGARFDAPGIDRISTGTNRNTCVTFIRCNLPGGE